LDARQAFAEWCQGASVQGELAVESGDWAERIATRSALADLVVIQRDFPGLDDPAGVSPGALAIIRASMAPVLVVVGEPSSFRRLLLAYDSSEKAREALFVATYMAERWQSEVVVLRVNSSRRPAEGTGAYLRDYLTMHEVEATVLVESGPVVGTILRVATERQCDALIVGGYGANWLGRTGKGANLRALLDRTDRPVMVCP
jgi:nucleotide-binding universal stress UspA family protein